VEGARQLEHVAPKRGRGAIRLLDDDGSGAVGHETTRE
jgi:hypothetical protein